MEDKKWIKYDPEGKDTKQATKMTLRNMVNNIQILCPSIQITYTKKDDYNDDMYKMKVGDREVTIRASEKGQTNLAEPGIFFLAPESKKDTIEKMLMKVLN